MKRLKVAVEEAQLELRTIANKGIPLVKPLGLLSGVLSCVSEGGEVPVLMATDACEAIVDCAKRVEVAETEAELRCIVDKLSPVVARLLGGIQ